MPSNNFCLEDGIQFGSVPLLPQKKTSPKVREKKSKWGLKNSEKKILPMLPNAEVKLPKAMQKSLSFRVFATIGTFAVAFAFTGSPFTSMGLATAQALTNTTIYYYHEKFWDKKETKSS